MSGSKINNINSYEVNPEELSPGMKAYLKIRKENPHAIIFYRMGDFYETFFEDALTVSKALEITLTSRESGPIGRIPMAGVPAKAVEIYIARLVQKGYKVAICEQMEKPSEAQGNILKREVVKTITAGTLTDDELLVSKSNNYLASVIEDKNKKIFGLAYTDITTGEFRVTQTNINQIVSELARINPAEVLGPSVTQKIKAFQVVPEEIADLPEIITNNYKISTVPKNAYDVGNIKDNLKTMFKTITLDKQSIDMCKLGYMAAGAIIYYLIKTQKSNLPLFNIIKFYNLEDFMIIDAGTRRNLEIISTMKENKKQGTLLSVIDKTCTNMGGRHLKKWLSQPLTEIGKIKKRQEAIEELIKEPVYRTKLTNLLNKTYDIERFAMKIASDTSNPQHYISLKNSLSLLGDYEEILTKFKSPYLNCLRNVCELLEFADIIDRTINEDAPQVIKEGNIIKPGVKPELDHYRDLVMNSESWINDFQEKERLKTGIKTLRVNYNRNVGYFIEVTSSFANKVPPTYIRRQTLKGTERFINDELREHETDVVIAKTKSIELETKVFYDFRKYSKEYVDMLFDIAKKIAKIDVLLSFATVAIENDYVKPEVIDENSFYIKDGRHPVIEQLIPMGEYVSNDLSMGGNEIGVNDFRFMVLTGPNMAGKSTFMRQNALIAILGQVGAYVPAKEARIGIIDKIFTRVGAVDDLALGQSTFMVEMNETAHILNNATNRSFILLDEIGRGTSTYDGVAIAWSVAWYISQKINAKTLFATHYHELNVMANLYSQIKNFIITIEEKNNEIVFLRKVIEGQTSKSYGIHVAKMAGLPEEVINMASDIMKQMQRDYSQNLCRNKNVLKETSKNFNQLSLNINGNENN